MDKTPNNFPTTILWITAAYYALCGLSAILYPNLWLFASGLHAPVTTELSLAFGVAGVYLLTMAFGACVSALAPRSHSGIILTLVVGNALDFAVTLRAVVAQELPILNGGFFILITVSFVVVLSIVYLKTRLG